MTPGRRSAIQIALVLLAVAALAVSSVACRSDGPNATGATSTASATEALDAPGDAITIPTSATSSPSNAPDLNARAACDSPRPHAPGDAPSPLASGGLDRKYLLHVPPSYDGTRQTPLVLNLHGFGSNGRQQALYSGLPAKGDREGFIVVSPDGTGTPLHWTYPGLGIDDIAFIRDLFDQLEGDLCIDPHRIFVAGISNGAAFAQQVACAMPDRIAAVAAVAALVYPARCGTTAPIAVIGFHGTDDPCVPFQGGTSQCGQRLPVPAIETSAKNWAAHDGCDIAPAEQQFSAHVRTIAYSRCKDETAVVLFVVDGGGHTWPGAIDVARLGATTHEINATDQIWEFFVAQGNLRASR